AGGNGSRASALSFWWATSAGTHDAGNCGAPGRPGASRSRVIAVPSPCLPVKCSSARVPPSRGVGTPDRPPRPSPGRLPWFGPGGGAAASSEVGAIGLGPGACRGGSDPGDDWLVAWPAPKDPPLAIRSDD